MTKGRVANIVCESRCSQHCRKYPNGIFWHQVCKCNGNFKTNGTSQVRHFVRMRKAVVDALNTV